MPLSRIISINYFAFQPVLSLCCLFLATSLLADDKPRWELGVGVASLVQPDYLGSNEDTVYASPFPFFVYRTPNYSVNRSGVVGRLFGMDNITAGLSFGVSLPVDSEDNSARRGMSDLDPTFEIGPALTFRLFEHNHSAIDFQLPARAAVNFRSGDYEGVTTSPRMIFRQEMSGFKTSLSGGLLFSNRKFHERLYSVNAFEATDQRAVYNADGGFSGARFGFSLSKRTPDYLAAFYANYTDFGDAINRNSPLLTARRSWSFGFMATWIFDRSETLVGVSEMESDGL